MLQLRASSCKFLAALAPLGPLTLAILVIGGCGQTKTTKDTKDPAPKAPEAKQPPEPIVHVPVGEFTAGSKPGETGRDPSFEVSEQQVELGPFRIDVLPFPGEPGVPRKTGVSVAEAQALCASRQGRLCTELEWERACRGPDSSLYPSGSEPCPSGESMCLSGFDVANMGLLPEWTASHFGAGSEKAGEAVTRGAPASSSPKSRRCARRAPAKKSEEVGFRCCYGAPNAAQLKEPSLGPAYQEKVLKKAELRDLLRQDPRTEKLANEADFFAPVAARSVLDRGPGDTMGFTLTTGALLWQPARGTRFLVIAGHSGKKTAFVLVYFLAEKAKSLAASFIMENEPGPIALAYADSIRPRLHFSGCWGCPGESGKVLFRPPEEVVMIQP